MINLLSLTPAFQAPLYSFLAIRKAREFAVKAHGDQKYGPHPYWMHLASVADLVAIYCANWALAGNMVAAAWLHDVLEDCPSVTAETIKNEFGTEVHGMVVALTNEPGKNRRERHEKTYPKLKAAGPNAIAVKLCDRLANIDFSIETNDEGKLKMYRKEYPEFRAQLFDPEPRSKSLIPMWHLLDDEMGYERK